MNRILKILCLSVIMSLVMVMPVMAKVEHEHTWTEWTVDYDATCIDDGRMSRHCTDTECNQEDSKVIPATGHNWVFSYKDYDGGYSPTQHRVVSYYYCSQCYSETGTEKSESELENHNWSNWKTEYAATCDEEGSMRRYCTKCDREESKSIPATGKHTWSYGDKYSFTKKSTGQHTYKQWLDCKNCYHGYERTVTESHHFNKYNECKECDFVKAKNITLKAGKSAYANEKSWIKIKVKKKGYLVVNVKEGKGSKRWSSDEWKFYDAKKKVFLDQDNNWGKVCVPVKKGTYYIRTNRSAIVKYTFKKDPSKKNYTQSKAQRLKKKKAVTGAIYPSASKKTWTRYYKVRLTKKQFLRYSFTKYRRNEISFITSIRDAKGNWYSNEQIRNANGDYTNKWTSSEKLKKGTYYIVVDEGYKYTSASRKRNAGTVFTLKLY